MSPSTDAPSSAAVALSEPRSGARLARARHVQRLLVFDLLGMGLAFIAAWFLRLKIPSETLYLPLSIYAPVAILLATVILALMVKARMYSATAGRTVSAEVFEIATQGTLAIALFIAAAFWFRDLTLSRLLVGLTWILLLASLIAGRLLARALRNAELRQGIGTRRLLLLGAAGDDQMLGDALSMEQKRGQVLVERRPLDPEQVPLMLATGNIDELIVHGAEVPADQIFLWGGLAAKAGIALKVIPPGATLAALPVTLDPSTGVPLLEIGRGLLDPAAQLGKRLLDIVLALIALPFALLIGLPVALLIAITSPGAPVLFSHTRLGRGGVFIKILKFRTMVPNAEAVLEANPELRTKFEAEYKLDDDPRQTPLGRALRKSSLDELPQLWNILRAEMSFVGPRPIVPPELAKYGPYRDLLLAVPPGLTGMWQVSGRSSVSYDERVQLDMLYIERWSIILDLKILALTIPAVLSRRGAG